MTHQKYVKEDLSLLVCTCFVYFLNCSLSERGQQCKCIIKEKFLYIGIYSEVIV